MEEIHRFFFVCFKKSGREVEDQAAVWKAAVDDGTVHFSSRYKYEVERLQLVCLSFNVVTDVSGFKKEQLVKAVVVRLKFAFLFTYKGKNAEVIVKIAGLYRKSGRFSSSFD